MRAVPWVPFALLFLATTCLVTCGGTDSSATPDASVPAVADASTSGVLGTKQLLDLTEADVELICDWVASLYSGYGNALQCADGTIITGPASLAECKAQAALTPLGCQATVAQSEACTLAIANCNSIDDAESCAAMAGCVP